MFDAADAGVAGENVQARIRGNVLMTISNKFGWMVLTTGQQERDGDRLRHALRRHGRRLRGHQGRREDVGVRALPRSQRARRPRGDPAGRDRQAAVGRAATRSEGHRLAAAVRRARPDHRGLRRARPVDRRARSARPRSASSCGGSRAWSTATSTSAARPRRACGCRPRRSARIGGCRSPTAGPADAIRDVPSGRSVGDAAAAAARARAARGDGRVRSTFVLVQDALEHVTPVGFILLAVRGRRARARAVRARARAGAGRASTRRSAMFAPAMLAFGVVAFVGYWFQNAGLERTTTSNSAFITGLFVVFTPLVETVVLRKAPATERARRGRRRDRRALPAHRRRPLAELRRPADARLRVLLRHLDLHGWPALAALRPDRA